MKVGCRDRDNKIAESASLTHVNMSDQFSRMSDQNLLLRMSQNGKEVIISTVKGRQGIHMGK